MSTNRNPGDTGDSSADAQELRSKIEQKSGESPEPHPDGIELDTRALDEDVASKLLSESAYDEEGSVEDQEARDEPTS